MITIEHLDQTIAVTGASGFLGGNLARFFAPACKLVAAGNRNIPSIPGCRCVRCDITSERGVKEFIRSHTPTWVVHCAALTSPDDCAKSPDAARLINTEGTRNIVNYANDAGIPVISISTDLVFDGTKGTRYTENDQPNPLSLYGETKLLAEDFAVSGLPSNAVMRIALSYGRCIPGARGGYLDRLLDAFGRRETQKLYTDQFRTPLFAGDFCTAIYKLITATSAAPVQRSSTLYHIGGKERISRFEFAMRVAQLYTIDRNLLEPSTMDAAGVTVKRGADCSLAHDRAHDEFGYQPGTLEENLKYDMKIRKEHNQP